jgi:hypothetical protein
MLDTNPEKVPYLRTGTYARTIWIIDINYYFSQKKNMNYYFRKAKFSDATQNQTILLKNILFSSKNLFLYINQLQLKRHR